jgi:hypothetical protein
MTYGILKNVSLLLRAIIEFCPESLNKSPLSHTVWVRFILILCHTFLRRKEVCSSVVNWGVLVQAGRARVRFPMRLLDFLIGQKRAATVLPWVLLTNRNEYQKPCLACFLRFFESNSKISWQPFPSRCFPIYCSTLCTLSAYSPVHVLPLTGGKDFILLKVKAKAKANSRPHPVTYPMGYLGLCPSQVKYPSA